MIDKSIPNPMSRVPGRYELGPTTALAPTPVVMVSSHGSFHAFDTSLETEEAFSRPHEQDNLAAVAWAGVVCTSPPQIAISLRPSRLTHEFISASSYFAVNLVDRKLAEACDWVGVVSGREYEKIEHLKLETFDLPESNVVGLSASPLVLSCRVKERLELGSHDLFIADVLNVYARADLMDEKGGLHLEQASLVAYAHGCYYGLAEVIGFFGYSVAKPELRRRRLSALRLKQELSGTRVLSEGTVQGKKRRKRKR